jgi:hypothetical protein
MGLFNNKNPAKTALPYTQNIPGMTLPYQAPYYNAGVGALTHVQDQYGTLLNNPGGKLNDIGQSYQQSPGLKFAIEQAMGGAGRAAAAGGMAGSPAHQQYNMELATNLANQDYNNWLGQATGLYNQGLHGEQGLVQGGQQAGNNISEMIANALQQSGNLAFRGQQDTNSQNNSTLSGIGRGIGALGAFTPFGGLINGINSFMPWGGGSSPPSYSYGGG